VAVAVKEASVSWLTVKEVGSASQADRLQQAGLHPGEAEAIVLATEVHSRALLMDDRDGIQIAAGSGVNVIRTPGIYRLAKGGGSYQRSARSSINSDRRGSGFATSTTGPSWQASENSEAPRQHRHH
jgi:predicted nucleic acid-binding protein